MTDCKGMMKSKVEQTTHPVLCTTWPSVETATSRLVTAAPSNRASTINGISSEIYCRMAKPPWGKYKRDKKRESWFSTIHKNYLDA